MLRRFFLLRIDLTALSSLSTTAPRPPSIVTKTHHVFLQSSLLVFSSVILAASAATPHPRVASLLNFSSISSFVILCAMSKKMSYVFVHLSKYFFSVLQAEPLGKTHLTLLLASVLPSCSCFSMFQGCVFLSNRFSGPFPASFFVMPSIS